MRVCIYIYIVSFLFVGLCVDCFVVVVVVVFWGRGLLFGFFFSERGG